MKDRVHVGVIQLYYVLLKLTRRWPAELQKVQDSAAHALEDVREKAQVGAAHVAEDVRERAGSVVAGGREVVWGKKD